MDVDFFKQNSKNVNTTKATDTWYRNFDKWCKKEGKDSNIESLDKHELNKILELYFATVKKNNGEEYEPSSLANMQAGIERYIKEKGCHFSILNDLEFKGSRDVLEGRGKYLRQELGMGKKPNKAQSLTREEENILWDSGQLGMKTGRSLTNSIWYLLTQHFGLRGRQEHHTMRVDDFIFKTDDEGHRFMTFKEGLTKTRGGGLRKKERLVIPKMFETGDDRCPVKIFESFLSRRPLELRNTGPLYLAIIDNLKSDIWFKVSRLGVNSLGNIMKSMTAGLQVNKRLTNHSARRTVVKKLRQGGKNRSEIIEITGHTNERGLDPYDSGDEVQQRDMSLVIDQPGPSHVKKVDKSMLPQKPNFTLLSDELEEKMMGSKGIHYNFVKCNVTINQKSDKSTRRKRVRVVCYSTNSS